VLKAPRGQCYSSYLSGIHNIESRGRTLGPKRRGAAREGPKRRGATKRAVSQQRAGIRIEEAVTQRGQERAYIAKRR
jgi:hypothetical protein